MRVDRRALLRTAGAILAAASLYTPAWTRNERSTPMTLVDPTLGKDELHAAGVPPAGNGACAIQPDFIRQWRDGLGRQIALAGSATAYVRWDKALLLTGLARESRMAARQRRLNRTVFEVSIG